MALQFLSVVSEIFMAIILHTFGSTCMEYREKRKENIYLTWVLFLLVTNVSSYLCMGNSTICATVMLVGIFCAYSVLFKGSIFKRILNATFVYVLGAFAEIIVSAIATYVLQEDMNLVMQSEPRTMLFAMLGKVFWFLFIKILSYCVRRNDYTDISFFDWIETFIIPVGSIIIIFTIQAFIVEDSSFEWEYTVATLLIMNFSGFFLYQRIQEDVAAKMNREFLQEQSAYYLEQCRELETLWLETQSLRHDMKNRYLAEMAYLENEKYDSLKEHYQKMIGGLQDKKTISDTGNVFFDAIVNYKADYANKMGIQVEPHIEIPCDLAIEDTEIGILVGNLLDNAIEALSKTSLVEKKIVFKVRYSTENLILSIANPFEGEVFLQKNGSFKTSKSDAKKHGFGLKVVKSIAEKYHGYVDVSAKDQNFVVKVFLYLS